MKTSIGDSKRLLFQNSTKSSTLKIVNSHMKRQDALVQKSVQESMQRFQSTGMDEYLSVYASACLVLETIEKLPKDE